MAPFWRGPTNPDDPAPFADRAAAGRAIAERLAHAGAMDDLMATGARPVVLGIPRGGIAVASEVARLLGAELDVVVAHKVGAPGEPELALGAVAAGGAILIEPWALDAGLIDEASFALEAQAELARARAREMLLRRNRPAIVLDGRTVIVVDDGMATGATMHVAVLAVQSAGARRIVVAVPVASDEAVAMIRLVADDVVAVVVPKYLRSVGEWYRHFTQVDDEEVAAFLSEAGAAADPAAG